mmetsp:Transcript_12520/g.24340  ORF Transcript_12520/g.24340 Transcript_12520/m.24340 type:complete len:114 (+) Transcript_12520:406-747(+)
MQSKSVANRPTSKATNTHRLTEQNEQQKTTAATGQTLLPLFSLGHAAKLSSVYLTFFVQNRGGREQLGEEGRGKREQKRRVSERKGEKMKKMRARPKRISKYEEEREGNVRSF